MADSNKSSNEPSVSIKMRNSLTSFPGWIKLHGVIFCVAVTAFNTITINSQRVKN